MHDGAKVPVAAGADAELSFVQACLDEGDRQAAIRELDRIWRSSREQQPAVAPMLGRLLAEEGEAAGLNLLWQSAEASCRPELEAELIVALWNFGRAAAASRRLMQALARYAVGPESALAACARTLVASGRLNAVGWAAVAPDWSVYAEAPRLSGPLTFVAHAPDRRVVGTARLHGDGVTRGVCLPLAPACAFPFLTLTVNGQPLLGGHLNLPPPWGTDARATAHGDCVEGWARLRWDASRAPEIEIADAGGRVRRVRARRADPEARWSFALRPRQVGLRGDRFELSLCLPDGTRAPFPDNPLLLESALGAQLQALTPSPVRTRPSQPPCPVDIVIPVYLGRERTLACIDAVLNTTRGCAADILVVDDATPDALLAADLDERARRRQIRLLRNATNLGFSASVNRAMAVNETHDAVLVNADVLVFGDWLQRLRRTAYRDAKVGSVTPMADDDSAVRYRTACWEGAAEDVAARLDAYAATAHDGASFELPVGVGFCMYIRRDCWRDTGVLDELSFAKGYGEECDWSMRARRRRWKHLCAADVFVHHSGSGSFGARRAALLDRSARILELRHPGYHRRVARFLKADPLHRWRRSFDLQLLRAQSRPVVLILTLALGGGVRRFVSERSERLQQQGRLALQLRPSRLGAEACVLQDADQRFPHLRFDMPDELEALREVLRALPIEAVEIDHFIGLDQRLIDMVRELGLPYDVNLHDYSWICPRVTLVDESGRYCGEPRAIRRCEQCVQRNGSDLLESIGVRQLRQRSARWLAGARRILAPSQDAATRYARYFPDLDIGVAALEPPGEQRPRQWEPSAAGAVRVALLGGVGDHKGYRVLLACARDARRRGLGLEFVVIGYSGNDAVLRKTGKVFVTGRYREGEARALLRRERPHLIWMPSVWPETWCYALSHAFDTGMPIVAFDIGAIAERLREARTGVLLPLWSDAVRINDELLRVAAGDVGGNKTGSAVRGELSHSVARNRESLNVVE